MDITKLIRLEPGHYVVAVSGGVDSMALMHAIAAKHAEKGNGLRFTVAHFDHGIRDDSHIDRLHVHEAAQQLGLPYVYAEGGLGEGANEAVARQARYAFLRQVQDRANARAIITAHHHDDVIETAILNLIRGTGRRGMTSLGSRDGLVRPLLHVPKDRLRAYAEANGLTWHEDSTNTDQKYRRNFVRHSVIKKAKAKSPKDYDKLVTLLKRQRSLNAAIDKHLQIILHLQPANSSLRRQDVISLPYSVATELVAEWLRANGKRDFSRWLIDRLTIAIRTATPRTELLLDATAKVSFSKKTADFVRIVQ